MGVMDRYRIRDVVADAMALYCIPWAGNTMGGVAVDVMVMYIGCDSTARSAIIPAEAGRLGISDDTLRRVLTDVLRPIIADTVPGRMRTLGVVARGRGVIGALEAVRLYYERRARMAAEPVDTCRIVDTPLAAAGCGGLDALPDMGTGDGTAVVS